MTAVDLPFAGLRVAAFESRRATEMQRLIERLGGVARVSPSMREVPVSEPTSAVDFAHRLISGQIDIVLLMTGVGTRHLVAQVERHIDRARFLAALSDVTTVARGPKPVAALREFDIQPTIKVPEPNTWREVLKTLDAQLQLANQTIGLQEYGKPNTSLVAGLEARGATVRTIKVYNWDFPEDVGPLEANTRALAAGQIDVVLFTSAHQVVNLLRIAERLGLSAELSRGLRRSVVASIGPTTSEMLQECEIHVDIEPEHPKMGTLVAAAAEKSCRLLRSKGSIASVSSATAESIRPAWQDSLFMKACRREPVDRVPIWLMRQAGRYMPEYREVRAKTTFLELCKNPQLCAEVMLTAVERLGVDAAIIFADLLPMLEPMGVDLEFAQGEGPVIHNPIRSADQVDCLRELEDVGELRFVFDTVRLTRAGLPAEIPVIGFAGAPFTLASYVIEGGASRNYLHTKKLMYSDEGAWNTLLGRLARSVTRYLNAQIEAGAQAVQLFDSWVGCLGPDDYRRYVLPHVRQIAAGLPAHVPLINFATGNPTLLPLVAEAGGSVIGVDWRVRLDDAWRTVGYDRAVQGNLDPLVLLGPIDGIRRRAAEVLEQAGGRPGHIFNLGHGILQQTPVENVLALIDAVRELSSKPRGTGGAVSAAAGERSVAVIGGGITGLAAAHRIHELDPSLQIRLYEAGPRLGGVLHTHREAGYLLELAADNFITNVPWAADLCQRVGLKDRLLSTNEAHRRLLVVRRGHLYPVPEGFMLMAPSQLWPVLASPILSWRGKLRLLAECLVPRRRETSDESVASFACRRLGREAFDRLVQPLLAGIYTADARQLSLAATLPRFIDMEQRHGSLIRAVLGGRSGENHNASQGSGARYSLFVAPEEGLVMLIEAIAQCLPAETVRLNSPVERLKPLSSGGWQLNLPGGEIAQHQAVIVATPAPITARLLAETSPGLSASLQTIAYAGSVVALAGFRREQIAHDLDGFGFVVPEQEQRQILSVSFSSQKYPGRAPAGQVLLRVFLGGSARPEMLEKPDDEIKSIVLAELAELLGVRGQPELFRIQRWPATMPQYHLGHLDRVAEIERLAAEVPGLQLAGNAYRGVGIPFCIRSGEQAAERAVAAASKQRAAGSGQ